MAIRVAWTRAEIVDAVEALFVHHAARLPDHRDARIVVKPNLNNDLVGLTGNSVDLRVLWAVLASLGRRGFTDVTVADGPNVGIDRRRINVAQRLKVDAVARAHGARLVDLNRDPGREVPLTGGARVRVATTVLDAECLISLPKVKTHAWAVLSSALKNHIGVVVGQDKRRVHQALAPNIVALHDAVRTHLVVLDGVVGMEGNGPGDGDPFRLGIVAASDHPLLNDLAVCRLVDLPWPEVPCLPFALGRGWLTPAEVEAVGREVPTVYSIRRAPPLPRLAVLAEHRALRPVRRLARPLVHRPLLAQGLYRLGVLQDHYDLRDSTFSLVRRLAERCGSCHRCEDVCPEGRTREQIGLEPGACLDCLYCWLVCPHDALEVSGEAGSLARQIARYRPILARI
ncbi:MAG: DUF362 domain-containing protein [Deltaproteobacteria bacterium]|nr:DUF362 domain-containing protein [Deltaproteobacteria bacterium]